MKTRLAAVVLLILPGTVLANRIVSYSVVVDGGPKLEGRDVDNGEASMASVWRRLGSTELKSQEGSSAVVPDQANPLQATLKGSIKVAVNQSSVQVQELRLVRASEQSGWTVHPDEVEATAKQAGFGTVPAVAPPPQAPEPPLKRSYVVWYSLAVVLIGLGAGLMARRRRKRRQVVQ